MNTQNFINRKPIPEIILLLAIVILGVIYVWFTWTRIEKEQSEKVLQIARSIEATLPIKELGALEAKSGDTAKPQYQAIKNMLKAIIRVNPEARFAYIYTWQNGKLYFIANSEPEDSNDYSPPGQEYSEADLAYFQPFNEGKGIITAPLTDRWGIWISALIPIKDEASGKMIAIFAMDFNAKSWDNLLLFEVIQSSVLIVFLLMTLLFLFIIKLKNKTLKNGLAQRKQAEDLLLDSKNQKAAILRAIPDLLFIFNQNGEYLEVYTENVSKLLMPRESLIGKNISDLFAPEMAAKAIDAFKQSLKSKELVQFFYSVNVSGKTEYYEARIVPASENTILTIVRDISESKEWEEALFKSRERSRAQRNAIARIAEDEVVSSGNLTGSFEKLTKEIAVAIQAERASIWLLSDDKTALRCIDLFERTTKKHSSGALLNSADYPRYFEAINNESRISAADAQNDDRTSEFANDYLVPLGISSMLDAGIYAEGELKGVVCLEHTAEKRTWYSDEESFASTIASIVGQALVITKRKLAERMLQAIITENPISIQIVDKQGFTLQVNSAHTALFGAVPPEGYSVFDDFQLKQQGFGALIERVKNGEVVHFPDLYYNAHHLVAEFPDVPVWIQMVIFPLNDSNGNPERFVLMHENITGRKQAEEAIKEALIKAESGNRLKTAFMNNISHEIRTPLNGILGFSNLIAQPDATNDEKMQFFLHLEKSSNRLLNTINDYMDISLIASGNMEVSLKPINLQSIFHNLFNKYQPLCAYKNLRLKLDIPNETEGVLPFSDQALFLKIMSHLLDNAVKFTVKGEITFGYILKPALSAVSTTKPASEFVEVEFFVNDTGEGIKPEALSLIFESFKQEKLSRKKGYEGSGLGLSIAKGLVQLLGGQIYVTSIKGTGSRFFFTMPNTKIPLGVKTEMKTKNLPMLDKPVILIAEDDESNLFYLEVILKKKLVSIISAINGKEAVDLCRRHPEISLVLMDIKMPVMDGLEATREIKLFRHNLPIIACTAFALSGDTKMAHDAGCDDYLSKPVNKNILLGKLEKYGVIV